MKKKKIAIIAAIAAVLVILLSVGLFVLFYKPSDKNKLPSTEETVVLGEVYEAASTIKDQKGNEYAVDAVEVYRIADGKQLSLIYGSFDILDLLGYKLVYTVTDEERMLTQEHYLRVSDQGKPYIIIEEKNIAEVGVKYTFPEITVKDLSGEEISYEIQVSKAGDTSTPIESDKEGFTPKEHGYYDLHISASDNSGNKAEAVYKVYARRPRYATELDAMDDEGIFATVYSRSGEKKEQAGFSSFGRLATSYGSAYVMAGTGETTGFYLVPRNEYTIMEQVGDDGYVSAWIYIATLKNSTKTLKCSNVSITVATNEWQEIRLTQEEVGQWPNFFNKLASGLLPLFEVVNDGEDYTVFVDDVFAVKNNTITLNGLKDSYTSGETISVTAEGAKDAQYEYYYAGSAHSFDGSFVPEMDGEYLINVYDKDRTAFISRAVTVGSMNVSVKDTDWYVLGQEYRVPDVHVRNGSSSITASRSTWLMDLKTGERTLLGDTFVPQDKIMGLYTECEANGKKSALFRILSGHEKAFGVWLDTDDPACTTKLWSWDNLSVEWLEEKDGEQGVLAIENKTGEEGYFNNRSFWQAIYSKEHYKRCSRLVFKMKATRSDARLDYIAEPSWTQAVVTPSFSTGDWTEYSIDFSTIYEHFEDFAREYQFHTGGSAPYTIYIADIRAVMDSELEDVSIKQGGTHDISSVSAFEGCQITGCSVSYQGVSVSVNGLKFTAKEAGQYKVKVSGYDHIGLYFENTYNVNSYGPEVWNDFMDKKSADVWKYDGVELSWLENYDGAAGVLKLQLDCKDGENTKYVGNTDGVNWPAVFESAADYRGANRLIFRIKIEGDTSNALQIFGPGEKKDFGKLFDGQRSTDGWQEFVMKVNVEENYDELNAMHFVFWSSGKSTIYIDKITAVYEPEPVADPNVWTGFDSADSAQIWTSAGVKPSWLKNYEGENGVLKLELDGKEGENTKYVGNTDGVNWPAVCKNAADYKGATGLVFRVKIEENASNALQVFGPGEKKDFGKLFDGQQSTDGWQEFVMKVNVEENYDDLNSLHFVFWTSEKSTIYIAEIRALYEPEPEADPNVWTGFDGADSAQIWSSAGVKKSWLKNYDGGNGILKLELDAAVGENTKYVGNTDGVNWPAVCKNAADYKGATGLAFRVKIEGNASNALQIYNQGETKFFGKVFENQSATDGWQEFVLKVNVEENYDDLNGMHFVFWTNGQSTIYMDEVRVLYEQEPTPPEQPEEPEEPETDPNMWTGFDGEECAQIWTGAGANPFWLKNYDGENGVFKLELDAAQGGNIKYVGNTGGVNWPAVCKSAADYKGATGLVFRVKIEGDASNALEVYNPGETKCFGKVFDNQQATDGWQEFILKVNVEENYDDLNGMHFVFWTNGQSSIYIDEIRVSYEQEPTPPEPVKDPNVWAGFDSADSADVSCDNNDLVLSWLESYEGADGVLKLMRTAGGVTTVGSDSGINWPALCEAADYKGAVGLIFRVKIEGEGSGSLNVRGKSWYDFGNLFDGHGATDGWQEFVIRTDVETDFDWLEEMFFAVASDKPLNIYLDEIRVLYREENWNGFDSEDCVKMWGYGSAQRTWLENYEGAEGVMKIDLKFPDEGNLKWVGASGGVNWPAASSKAEAYRGAVGLIFRAKIEGNASNALTILGAEGQEMGKVFDGQTTTDGWTEFFWKVDVEKEYENLNKMSWIFWVNDNSTIYLDGIRPVYRQGNWNGFDSEDCVKMWGYGSAQRTWLESYEGARGVMKIDLKYPDEGNTKWVGASGGVNWPAEGAEASDYRGAVGLAFRVKIEGDASNAFTILGAQGQELGKVFDGQTATDGWKEFVWKVDVEKEYENLNRMSWAFWVNNNSTIYLDGIRAIYE